MAIQNLDAIWATDSDADLITDRLAGGITVTPNPQVDSAVLVGSRVPSRTILGVSYTVTVPRAYWDQNVDGLFGLNTPGWLCLFDLSGDKALLTPAVVTVKPVYAITADPAATMRMALTFEPTEDDRQPFHVAPGLAGADTTATITIGTGVAFTSGTGNTAIAANNDRSLYTLTAAEGE